jgi:hypothetical protein
MDLYHYRKLDERLIQYLLDQNTYFQCPLLFNDPFDFDLECLALGSPDRLNRDYRRYAGYLRQRAETVGTIQRSFLARLRDEQSDGTDPLRRYGYAPAFDLANSEGRFLVEELARLETDARHDRNRAVLNSWKRLRRRVAESYGVVCFSENPSDMLMWSHYTNGHRGVCLEFDSEERPIKGWKQFQYLRVRYVEDRRTNVFEVGLDVAYYQLLTSKGPDWAYEKEHRLITIKGPGFQHGSLQSVTGIILGERIRDNAVDLRQRLYAALANHQRRRRSLRALSVWRAEKVPGRFQLRLKRVSGLRDVATLLDTTNQT